MHQAAAFSNSVIVKSTCSSSSSNICIRSIRECDAAARAINFALLVIQTPSLSLSAACSPSLPFNLQERPQPTGDISCCQTCRLYEELQPALPLRIAASCSLLAQPTAFEGMQIPTRQIMQLHLCQLSYYATRSFLQPAIVHPDGCCYPALFSFCFAACSYQRCSVMGAT